MTAITNITIGPLHFPPWALMWALMLLMFGTTKLFATWRVWRISDSKRSALAFLFTWVGMNPREWENKRNLPRHDAFIGFCWGTAWLLLGITLIWGVARLFDSPLAAGWCGMVGFVLTLHFGLFRLLAEFWRWQGRAVRPIMYRPVFATSLADFWGRRWNRAFRDLAHELVFRPLQRRLSPAAALIAGFAVSGLVHEAIITIPAGASYGLPTCYFLLQGIGILIERKFFIRSWWFTHAFTLLPIALVFPPAFVLRVMTPFFQFIGALPTPIP